MKSWINFCLTMVIGGATFLLPLVVLTVILTKAHQVMLVIARPAARFLPLDRVGSVAMVNVVAALLVVLGCFLAGLVARRRRGRGVSALLDENLQLLLPGYALLRSKVASAVGAGIDQQALRPVYVQFDDQGQIAFEVERAANGQVAIFLPGAPDPWSGTTVFVEPQRVSPLDAELRDAVRSLKQIGRGSGAILTALSR